MIVPLYYPGSKTSTTGASLADVYLQQQIPKLVVMMTRFKTSEVDASGVFADPSGNYMCSVIPHRAKRHHDHTELK